MRIIYVKLDRISSANMNLLTPHRTLTDLEFHGLNEIDIAVKHET